MAVTYKKIASVTVGSGGAATIAFSSIPSTYTDLKILLSGRTTFSGVSTAFRLYFNADTTSANYTYRVLYAVPTTVGSESGNFKIHYTNGDTGTASTFGNTEIYIPNYTSSNAKSVHSDSLSENNATANGMGLNAYLWSGTAVIDTVTLSLETGSFKEFSTATLYGISKS